MHNFGEMFGKHDYYVFCSHIPPLEGALLLSFLGGDRFQNPSERNLRR